MTTNTPRSRPPVRTRRIGAWLAVSAAVAAASGGSALPALAAAEPPNGGAGGGAPPHRPNGPAVDDVAPLSREERIAGDIAMRQALHLDSSRSTVERLHDRNAEKAPGLYGMLLTPAEEAELKVRGHLGDDAVAVVEHLERVGAGEIYATTSTILVAADSSCL